MFMLPSASLVSKAAIEAVGFFDESLIGYEDDDLFIRMFAAGYRFVYLNEAVTKWRIYSSWTSFSSVMSGRGSDISGSRSQSIATTLV
jgi:cellulose synthase/poly-beta-1,6-N-acetylglucosamine synthase-like glycosyltransferase